MVPFTPAWLRREPHALPFLADGFRRPEDRALAVARASERPVHAGVLASLVATTEAQRANRDALAAGAAVVVTGQQAGLFGGPLYTIAKAAAAIVDARALAEETGRPVVPVFWLQNEDHDYAEIASTHVLAGDGRLRALSVDVPDDRPISVGARRLGTSVLGALDDVAALLAGLSEAEPVVALLRDAYRPERSPDAAFRQVLDALFAVHGLLVLDPRHPAVVEAARPVHARALAEAARFADVLTARADALRAAGFAVQVHVRPSAPLSFVHPEGLDGPRSRVDHATDAPAYSTSALLRPLLQDTLLPTAAYVGGPGELAYFAQLPPLYEAWGLPMPLIVPRASFRVVDEGAARLLEQLGLSVGDVNRPREELLARVARATTGLDPDAFEAALVGPLRAALAEFQPHAEALDKGLAKVAEKSSASLLDTAARLVERYRLALAKADEVTVDRLDRLLARLQPGGAPQERVHGWPWFLARYGPERFVGAVIGAVAPFDGNTRELRP